MTLALENTTAFASDCGTAQSFYLKVDAKEFCLMCFHDSAPLFIRVELEVLLVNKTFALLEVLGFKPKCS